MVDTNLVLNSEINIELEIYSVDLALKMIPEFSGNREVLHKFVTCVDIVRAMCTTNAHKINLLNVVTNMCGSAYLILLSN